MATSRIEGEGYFQIDNDVYNEELNKTVLSILPPFDRLVKSYQIFNLIFILLAITEVAALIIFFTFFIESFLIAFGLATIFLTFFSYFTLKIYMQAKKPEQFEDFKERYARGCKNIINYREGIPEHHIALANAFSKLAKELQAREYSYFSPPFWIQSIAPSLEKLSCWCFWKDIHEMQEQLLQSAIDEHIKLVQIEPTSLDIHASLANAYVILSSLYINPKESEQHESDRWVPSLKFSQEFKDKFRQTAEKAIEEFKILNDYAPNDPWIHTQLAYSYHDLQMPKEEIAEYETILKLRPDDKETLFKLGCMYFQQGRNADGLQIYEKLKLCNFRKAEQLIAFYGAHNKEV